ncbi:MAG: DsrE/DsrF/DrsH-like family protein [Deltaproteobacteria bacterium]|uniref:DsrE/DsrF/DrsH-like family protein n=1 Tax=Candidatus Zymogenus saltonus TaxID=2844893 RepID=A0A9D8KDE3_9DELT|nr:DsrE/DsrF/DrsH-like family protein [Candidatus Zymogenus saltonus]
MSGKDKATIIVFSDDIDKVLAAFNIATGAAAMGMDVSIFFTFWGLNVVRKERSAKSPREFLKKTFGIVNRGGASRLKLSKFHMGGIGTWMMKILMKKSMMLSVKEMIGIAHSLGVTMIACTTSMEFMGVDKEDIIDEVTRFAGVATYLAMARESKINLFI